MPIYAGETSPAGTLAEETVRLMLESMPDGVLLVDEGGRIAYVNSRLESLTGYERSELLGEPVELLVPGELREAHRHQRVTYFKRPVLRPMGMGLDLHVARKDGTILPVDIALSPIELAGSGYVIASIRDMIERAKLSSALRASERRYRELFERNTAGAFLTTPEGKIIKCNEAFARMFGYESTEALEGLPADQLYALPEDREPWLIRLRREGTVQNYEIEMRRRDGSRVWALEYAFLTEDPDLGSEVIMGMIVDLTERKKLEMELEQVAFRDALTGLPNRKFLEVRAERVLSRAERRGAATACLYVDIRRFRRVNTSLGHELGDRILVHVAKRLSRGCNEPDVVARLGADEFGILLTEVADLEDALTAAAKLRESLAAPFRVGERSFRLDASIGVAMYPEHARSFEKLLQCAHHAMSAAASNDAYVHVFGRGADRSPVDELADEQELSQALAEGQLALYYQPIVELHGGGVKGAEALVRWNHPERDIVTAGEFVPFAERSGLIAELDRWVLRAAVEQLRRWRGRSHFEWITVNLSAESLGDFELVDYVGEVLELAGVEGGRLVIEITERMAMRDPESVSEALSGLRELGVHSMIDDFGTGHSSLAYLKHLPVRALKVDRSFVADLTHDPKDEALVQAIIGMGHGLKLEVIAEGVEEEPQRSWLESVGCDYVQGFLVGRPAPADEF